MLSKEGEIRRDDSCLDYAGRDIILFSCHGGKGNQEWSYNHETMTLKHPTSGKCLTLATDKKKLQMEKCDINNEQQRWKFGSFNGTITN